MNKVAFLSHLVKVASANCLFVSVPLPGVETPRSLLLSRCEGRRVYVSMNLITCLDANNRNAPFCSLNGTRGMLHSSSWSINLRNESGSHMKIVYFYRESTPQLPCLSLLH